MWSVAVCQPEVNSDPVCLSDLAAINCGAAV